jgi:methyltransferase-like protein/trans-aconitate methyltransferase
MNTYDQISYPSLVYTDTHPNRLATLALLFGLKPPIVNTCRVLELGCGDGTNIIAIAQSLPQASLLGIDFSAQHIAKGQAMSEAIKLDNLRLKQLDFNEIDTSLGEFDYIIAHGVYSWVPEKMQKTVLEIIQRHLAPNGIAYVSYNVYPGWHLENVVRDMMRYHTQQLPELPFSVQMMQAKGIVRFLANLRQQGDEAFDLLLQEKSQQLQTLQDNYLYHDFLEEENHPVYFYQFIEQLVEQRLAYITDIEFRHYLMLSFPDEVVEAMLELFQEDFFKKEQYLDFFYNRTLRRTLVCHQDMNVHREVDWNAIASCYIAAFLRPNKTIVNNDQGDLIQFQKADGELITVKQPLIQIALNYLTRIYPQSLYFETLFQYVCEQLPQSDQNLSRETFAQALLALYKQEAIELSINTSTFVTTISKHPIASPLARFLASQGEEPLINLRCELIEINPISRTLLPHLNGKNSRQALLLILKKLVKKQTLTIEEPLGSLLDNILLEIAQCALLVA